MSEPHDHSGGGIPAEFTIYIDHITDETQGVSCNEPGCKDKVEYIAYPIYSRMGDGIMIMAETYLCCYHAGVINP